MDHFSKKLSPILKNSHRERIAVQASSNHWAFTATRLQFGDPIAVRWGEITKHAHPGSPAKHTPSAPKFSSSHDMYAVVRIWCLTRLPSIRERWTLVTYKNTGSNIYIYSCLGPNHVWPKTPDITQSCALSVRSLVTSVGTWSGFQSYD